MWRVIPGLLMSLMFCETTMASLVVEMLPTAQVKGEVVTLGDIAKISCQCNKGVIKKIEIGHAPRIGYVRQVTTSEIQHRLLKAGYSSEVNGGKSSVTRIGQNLGSMELLNNAQSALEAWLVKRKIDVYKIKSLSTMRDISVPIGDVNIKYEITVPKIGKKVRVWQEIYVSGNHYQTLPLWFEVSAETMAYVALNDLEKGGPLKGHVAIQKVEITDIGEEYLRENIGEVRTRKAVRANHALVVSEVEPIPAVQMGTVIAVTSTSGSVAIQTKGYALEDGKVGEVIKLQSLDSGSQFNGRVMMKNAVIALGGE